MLLLLVYTLVEGLGPRYQADHSPFAQPAYYYPEGKVHLFHNSSTESRPRRVAASYLRKKHPRDPTVTGDGWILSDGRRVRDSTGGVHGSLHAWKVFLGVHPSYRVRYEGGAHHGWDISRLRLVEHAAMTSEFEDILTRALLDGDGPGSVSFPMSAFAPLALRQVRRARFPRSALSPEAGPAETTGVRTAGATTVGAARTGATTEATQAASPTAGATAAAEGAPTAGATASGAAAGPVGAAAMGTAAVGAATAGPAIPTSGVATTAAGAIIRLRQPAAL